MPQGNAHMLPPGLWYQEPATSSIRWLLFKSASKFAGLLLFFACMQQYRSLSWKYTYKPFIGNTMSLGKLTVMDHEPLTAEEIDRLKEEQANRKNVHL